MKKNKDNRMHGIGMELIKVVFMFSMVSEILVTFIAALQKDVNHAYWMLVLILVPMISVFLRRFVHKFGWFFLAHAALMGSLFLMPTTLTKVFAGIYIAADIIYIYVRRTSGTDDPMSAMQLVISFVVAFVLYITVGKMDLENLRPMILAFFIFHISVYMIYFHQLNVRDALEASAEHLNQATKKLNGINNKIIAFYVVIMLLLIGVGVVLRMDVVFSMIGQLLLLMVRAIVKLVFREKSGNSEVIVGDQPEGMGGDSGGPAGEFVTYEFWFIIEKIVMAVCLIAAIIGLVYLAYRFYKRFMQNRIEEHSTADFEETTVFVEKAQKVRKERKSLFDYFNLTNDKKVRHIYAKKIQKQIKAGVPVKSSQTVQEIRQIVEKENLTRITELYEKARYSDQPISKEEVKSVE